MEEDNCNPSEINSVDFHNLLNKKRKVEEEQLGLPLPKHQCWDQSFGSECDSPKNENTIMGDCSVPVIRRKTVGGISCDESDLDSAKDSKSFGGDTDSAISLSGEANRGSVSSVKVGSSRSFKNSTHSLDSETETKAGTDRVQQSDIGRDYNVPDMCVGIDTYLNFDEDLQEFGGYNDYSFLEYGEDSIGKCTEKELEDVLYSKATLPTKCVLSPGRLAVSQENQPSTEKPTIDVEFEQYFSMLMP